MQKQNPLLRIWGWGKDEHGGLIFAIVSALIGVALGMLPYYAAAQIIIGMLSGERSLSLYLPWLGLGLAGYAARTLLYNMALSVSHKATFSILKTIRQRILEKLPKLPLGTVMDMQSGKMKQIIVDQVDGMETTLAHLFPELTANIGGPVLIIIYLFVLDWRMALLSLVTIPVGMVFMMSVMGNYSRDYEGAVKTTQEMLKDAPIVILDEATAYIDPENEAVIQKAIAKLVQGKTVIVIAHRLSTIKDADQIVVVKDGKIEAVGKHEELRNACPLYESMWQAHIGAKDGDVA